MLQLRGTLCAKSFIVALAALAATASFAQSTVTIDGLVDIGYQNVSHDVDAKSSKKMAQNGSATTTLNFSGSEDLGGGMKANFRVEFNPDLVNGGGVSGISTAGATGGMHQTFLGLSGGFGEVKMGRVNTPALSAWGVGSVFGTALGSGYSAGQNIYNPAAAASTQYHTYPTRYNGAVEYTTPSFSGLTARLYYVPKNDKSTSIPATGNNAGVTDLGLAYANGPLNIAFSSQSLNVGGVNAVDDAVMAANVGGVLAGETLKVTQNTLAANYNFGAATVYGAYWTTKATGFDGTTTEITKRSGQMVGVKYAVTSTVDLMASYGKADRKDSTADGKVYGLGADYKLSKRTAIYARYADLDTNTGTTNSSSKTTAIGVRHTF